MTTKTEPKTTNTDSYVALIDVKNIWPPVKADEIRRIDIETLGLSIKAIGLINPITVVQDKDKKYRIIAGRRRYWACLWAVIKEIPCHVMLTNETAANRIIEVTENLHRLQLTPMQEANAIEKLRKLKMTDESIAADLGMTGQFVARRAKLLDLSPTWQKALSGKSIKGQFGYVTETNIRHWPVACLELIARYDKKRQDELITSYTHDIPNIDDLKKQLSMSEHKLLGVPWKLDDESLYPKAGSCANCPKRSGVQPLLFDDDVSSKKTTTNDKCLDNNCFVEKMTRHVKIKLTEAQTKHPNAILISSFVNYTNERGKNGLAQQDYEIVKKKTKESKFALLIDGNHAGKTLYITTAKGVKTKSGDAKKKSITDKDRAQRLRNRRNKWIVDYVRVELCKTKSECLLIPKDVLAVVILSGLTLQDNRDYVEIKDLFPRFAKNLKRKEAELVTLFWKNFRGDIARRLNVIQTGIVASEVVPTLYELFGMMGTSYGELWTMAAKEIPDKHNYLKERKTKKK